MGAVGRITPIKALDDEDTLILEAMERRMRCAKTQFLRDEGADAMGLG